jgi:outer membrane protein OmpA-like peptidoglycan-associated protein
LSEGIPLNRIETIGYGMSKPVASNSTAEGRQRNRRVEIVIQ